MSRRPPNEHESKLHQAALASPNNELSARQTEAIVPDPKAREKALNFLLSVGLLRSLADKKGNLSFKAVTKSELNATKDLTAEENLVLSHIKGSSTEGIWTKHLKAKTNLHQTVIDRCLKTLTQRKLIKRVPSVQYPTRKIFMLESLEPSIALTGGPWYTDNEFDTEFIETLIKVCFKFIKDMSFPPKRHHPDGALYPISNSPEYPTAQQVRDALRKARLTETELSVEHVETLLNVLVLDGEIEKIPAFGTALWDNSALEKDGSEDEEETKKRTKKKSKRARSDSDEEEAAPRKRRRRAADESDDESDQKGKKKAKSKSKAKRKKHEQTSSDEESDAKSRKKKKKKKKEESESEESQSSDDSTDDESPRTKRRPSKSRKRSPSPPPPPQFSFEDIDSAPAFVYRAIKQERLSLGWTQAPCSICPSFEFCKDGGPVNPKQCVYYGDWLLGDTVADLKDIED